MQGANQEELNIFVDEAGNFDCTAHGPRSYGIAFTFHNNANSITTQLSILNNKLTKAGYSGMIHLADLIAKRHSYADLTLPERQEIFWSIYNFTIHCPIQFSSIIIDKSNISEPSQLYNDLHNALIDFFTHINPLTSSYPHVVIYYDNGQKELAKIFAEIAKTYPNIEIRPNFDHVEKRLFQVSDMLTKLNKMQFDLDSGIMWTKGESYFFTREQFKQIMRRLKQQALILK